jgi:hypothetical protein
VQEFGARRWFALTPFQAKMTMISLDEPWRWSWKSSVAKYLGFKESDVIGETTVEAKYKIGFGHNDMLAANILYENDKILILIDDNDE